MKKLLTALLIFFSVQGFAQKQITVGVCGIDIKVDSVTVIAGADYYWINGVSHIIGLRGGSFIQNGVISGGIVTWLHDYVYNVSASTYYIDQIPYSSPSTDITLSAADATDDRIDLFVLTTSSTAIAVTGTPSTPAVAPDFDANTQFQISFATVTAATTEPPGIVNAWIYQENTEWTTAVSAGTIAAASTSSPYAGTKSVEGTAVANNQNIKFTSGTAPNMGLYQNLAFQVKSKANWSTTKKWIIRFYNGITAIGNPVTFGSSSYGFVSTNTTSYQSITIPLADFGNVSSATAYRITQSNTSGTVGWYLDNIQLQGGQGGGTPQTVTLIADVTGSGTNTISTTVTGIMNKTIPTLAAGNLKYSGSAWTFDNTAYATSAQLGAKLDTSGSYVNSGTIIWPGTIYSTPTTGVKTDHAISYSPALASQSAYTLFGRGSGTGVPSFLASIDSNWIPALHTENYFNTKYAAIGAISSQWTTSGSNIYYTAGNVLIGTSTDDGHTLRVNGSASFNLGSDATGDVFYRNATGDLTRLAAPSGITNPVLGYTGSAPFWTPITSSIDSLKHLFVDTSASPRNGYFLTFDSTNHKWYLSTSAGGAASQWVTNGTAIHYPTGRVGINSPAPVAILDIKGDMAATSDSSKGFYLRDSVAATVGNHKWSPPITLEGQGWKTNATAGSQSAKWQIQVVPETGTTSVFSNLIFRSSEGNGAYVDYLTLRRSGVGNANATFVGSVAASAFSGSLSGAVTANQAQYISSWQFGAASSQDAIRLLESDAASAGVPSIWSPRFHQQGVGWSGAASQKADFGWEVRPVSGTNPITANYVLSSKMASTINATTAMDDTWSINNLGKETLLTTTTTVGTTGNQTINKPTGTVNIAAAGTTVTVTNSLVSATSLVFCVIRTNDATARISNVVPAAGSFVINIVACTTEVSIGFIVYN